MTAPLVPQPDTKDWTHVVERPCAECGFDAAGVERDDVPARINAGVAAFTAVLKTPGATERPRTEVWSPLEYACHVRDVCRIFGARLASMRGTHDPLFANWDQDQTALTERYWAQDPVVVSAELRDEADRVAADFGTVRDDEWPRPGRRSNGSEFTIDTLARYFLHDIEHHVYDVTR